MRHKTEAAQNQLAKLAGAAFAGGDTVLAKGSMPAECLTPPPETCR